MEKEAQKVRTLEDVIADVRGYTYNVGVAFMEIKEAEFKINQFMAKIEELKVEHDALQPKEDKKA